ncbi:MAG: N-acetyl sugar amidotransferase [Phycisphaerales bacterium]|nr:N-acetyl sugar amidotransferase [Phycisphaerales bacterium]
MPETAETLSYDSQGVCSVCRQVEFKQDEIDWEARQADLDRLIEAYRGKYQYDCIVPFSGGKDSTFTLWYLMKEKGLRPLVVRFDHGFMRPTLLENNIRTFRTLGVDVITFTPNWQVVRKLMFESLRRRGDFCWHCHTGIFAYPMWVALEKQVPLIFWGEPSAEYASFYSYDEEEEVDEERFNLLVNLGINAEDMLGMLDETVSDYPVTARDLQPFTSPPAADLARMGVRSVPLGSFIPWDVRKQVDVIKRELGWQGDEVEGVPPQFDYEKIECFMQGVRDYVKHLKRGFGRTAHLTSIDVRNGRMSRKEALKLTEEYDGKRPAALDVFLDYLGINEAEFMDIVAPHVVEPHIMPSLADVQKNRTNQVPPDFDKWSRVVGDRTKDAKLG